GSHSTSWMVPAIVISVVLPCARAHRSRHPSGSASTSRQRAKPSAENPRAISMSSRTCFGRPPGLPDWPFWNGLPLGLRLGLAVVSLIAANCLDIGPSAPVLRHAVASRPNHHGNLPGFTLVLLPRRRAA